MKFHRLNSLLAFEKTGTNHFGTFVPTEQIIKEIKANHTPKEDRCELKDRFICVDGVQVF